MGGASARGRAVRPSGAFRRPPVLLLAAAVATVGALSGCASTGAAAARSHTGQPAPRGAASGYSTPCTAAAVQADPRLPSASDLLGLSLSAAEQRALSQHRKVFVVGQDGFCLEAVGLNLDLGRVRVYLQSGRVVAAAVG
jgi:hypothetical protein